MANLPYVSVQQQQMAQRQLPEDELPTKNLLRYYWYTNYLPNMPYKYARNYTANIQPTSIAVHQVSAGGADRSVNVAICAIPDGIALDVNEALVRIGTPRRLYFMSRTHISDQVLQQLDSQFGEQFYPQVTIPAPACAILPSTLPRTNFYMCTGPPSSTSEFVEYRYLQERSSIAQIAYDETTGNVYRLVLPKRQMLVLIMPRNFVRTGLKRGYFRFDNNIIIRCFSQYMLASEVFDETDANSEVTQFEVGGINDKFLPAIEIFFSRLGIHKITSNTTNQLYGYDKYITLVVGSIANIVLDNAKV